jgi:hypothetical protein
VAVTPADPPRKVPPAAAYRPVPRDPAAASEDLAAEAEAVAERRSDRGASGSAEESGAAPSRFVEAEEERRAAARSGGSSGGAFGRKQEP